MPIYGRGIKFQVRTAIYLTLLDMLTEQIHFFDTKVQIFLELHAKNGKIHATTTNHLNFIFVLSFILVAHMYLKKVEI